MRKIAIAAILALTTLAFSSATFGLEALGWRLTVQQAFDDDSSAAMSEVEWLYDDDDDDDTPLIDSTEEDLGEALCGWMRRVPNLTGTTSVVPTPCDSVSMNRRPARTNIPSGTRRTRLGKLMYDNLLTSGVETREKVAPNVDWKSQYVFYIGNSAPGRTRPDVTEYSITVPLDQVEDGKAPSVWWVEYLDPQRGTWIRFPDSEQGSVENSVFIDFERDGGDVFVADGTYYYVKQPTVKVWDGTDWSAPLTSSSTPTRAEALEIIGEDGVEVAKRMEFEL